MWKNIALLGSVSPLTKIIARLSSSRVWDVRHVLLSHDALIVRLIRMATDGPSC